MLLVLITAALAMADGFLTWKIITDKTGTEGNPLLRKLMGVIGLVPALVLTRLLVFVVLYLYPESALVLGPLFALVVVLNLRNVRW